MRRRRRAILTTITSFELPEVPAGPSTHGTLGLGRVGNRALCGDSEMAHLSDSCNGVGRGVVSPSRSPLKRRTVEGPSASNRSNNLTPERSSPSRSIYLPPGQQTGFWVTWWRKRGSGTGSTSAQTRRRRRSSASVGVRSCGADSSSSGRVGSAGKACARLASARPRWSTRSPAIVSGGPMPGPVSHNALRAEVQLLPTLTTFGLAFSGSAVA